MRVELLLCVVHEAFGYVYIHCAARGEPSEASHTVAHTQHSAGPDGSGDALLYSCIVTRQSPLRLGVSAVAHTPRATMSAPQGIPELTAAAAALAHEFQNTGVARQHMSRAFRLRFGELYEAAQGTSGGRTRLHEACGGMSFDFLLGCWRLWRQQSVNGAFQYGVDSTAGRVRPV